MDMTFFKGKTIFITGHTGFKGSWLCKILDMYDANIIGYSLAPPTTQSLFEIANINQNVTSILGDIRDLNYLKNCINKYQPEIVIHLAAQPIVRESYNNPVYTYETNIMGTVHILEAIRCCKNVKSFINVTTDKVYQNKEWMWGYRETDNLNGFDPYSNSKSCSELITSSYVNSFFNDRDIAISTCRAGNVIGGGDFAKDRIIPDCIRSMKNKETILVRNPYSVRPYQHVLEPLCMYLRIAAKQYKNKKIAGNYNIGPDDIDCVTTGALVDLFCKTWGDNASWKNCSENNAPHEANFLKLDCSKVKTQLNWIPKWHISTAVQKTVEWSKCYFNGENISKIMQQQIVEYLDE